MSKAERKRTGASKAERKQAGAPKAEPHDQQAESKQADAALVEPILVRTTSGKEVTLTEISPKIFVEAALREDLETQEACLMRGLNADVVHEGSTALWHCIYECRPKSIDFLLSNSYSKADATLPNFLNWCPLSYAVHFKQPDSVVASLCKGGAPLYHTKETGQKMATLLQRNHNILSKVIVGYVSAVLPAGIAVIVRSFLSGGFGCYETKVFLPTLPEVTAKKFQATMESDDES